MDLGQAGKNSPGRGNPLNRGVIRKRISHHPQSPFLRRQLWSARVSTVNNDPFDSDEKSRTPQVQQRFGLFLGDPGPSFSKNHNVNLGESPAKNLNLWDRRHDSRNARETKEIPKQGKKNDNNSEKWGRNENMARNSRGVKRKKYDAKESRERFEKRFTSQTHALGFKKLEAFLTGTPEDVLLKLLENIEAFSLLVNKSDISPDCLCLILKAIIKLSDNYFDQQTLKLVHIVTKENFIKELIMFITWLPFQNEKDTNRACCFWKNPDGFFLDLSKFCEMVLRVLPTASVNILPKLIKHSLSVIPQLKLQPDTLLLFQNLDNSLTTAITNFEKKKNEAKDFNEDELQPPENFRNISIFPLPHEIITLYKPFLRENIIEGAYKSIEHYLDVQFRLVRNDFVKPLRDGICSYLDKNRKRKIQNIKIYNGVQFLKSEMCSNASNGYLIQLPKGKNKRFQIKLENSKDFMFGSLVCFTKDNFANIMFGRIVERNVELLQKGQLIVGLHSDLQRIDFKTNYVMIEAKVYFEPYYYVLSALQHINEEDFPMREYIIDIQQNASIPNYHKENETDAPEKYRIPIVNGVLFDSDWPSADDLQLNAAQYAAYKNALSQKFAIIQGPPGTGKTHLGLKVAKTLIHNSKIWHKKQSPMMVICFTNHALDQFLEGLLPITKEIIRIGGQSKSKALEQYNIRNVRNQSQYHITQVYLRSVRKYASKLQYLYDILDVVRGYRGIVNIKPLLEKLPEAKYTWFSNICNKEFTRWLFAGTTNKHLNTLDEFKTQLQNKNEEAAGVEDEEEVTTIREIFEMFDAERSLNLDEDILNFNDSQPSFYMITLKNYEDNLSDLQQQANKSSNHVECITIKNKYRQMAFEYEYLQEGLKRGKNMLQHKPPQNMLQQLQNPESMAREDRWLLYLYWVKAYEEQILKSIACVEGKYHKAYREYEDVKMLLDTRMLREKLVVGITTTAAARLQSMLRTLRSRIVIVEEAAEVMEAHIITALTKHCDHVILIGDHQQLRPSTADFVMETKFKLGISLFERMVRNNVHCNVLEIQHRMRPEISKLIVPTIYKVLYDHESVHNFPPICGVDRNLYFVDHKHSENVERDDSKFNLYEVRYLINLAQYLIHNGYKPGEITILCAYSAQLFKMFQERKKYPLVANVRICVLDNYQGEENKIILLSLVRNNEEGKIGFLKIDNRICVALSRAREGLYIMGNIELLSAVSPIWSEIKLTLINQDSLGKALPLRCQVHYDKITHIQTIEDFEKVAEGGCDQICNSLMPCGHYCKVQCHIGNRNHSVSNCREKCLRKICDGNHNCPKKCYEQCEDCMVLVERSLKCGHKGIYRCSLKEPNCQEMVSAKLLCGHETNKLCYQPLIDVKCPHPCDGRIENCGHACERTCHINKDPDHLKYKCYKKCGRIRPNCILNDEEHSCTKRCFEECDKCDIILQKSRSCGHMFQLQCSIDIELMHCPKPCEKQLPCGHKCKQECSEKCGNCKVKVEKQIPTCGHTVTILCRDTPDRSFCTKNCVLNLPCGHQCQNRCKDECTRKCNALTPSLIPLQCGHRADIPCSSNKEDIIKTNVTLLNYCKMPCTKTLKCDHKCSGTCGECFQGRIHKACGSACGVTLICGHVCKTPCRQVCPPCTEVCEFACPHSKCKKKCGEPCTFCKERCTRSCLHQKCRNRCGQICSVPPCNKPCLKLLPCGHDCVGFCGDPCPPLCKVCNYQELVEEFCMGYEDEHNARFVMLKDCKHVIESRGMDMWLASNGDEINMKCCPRCKKTLINTSRYSAYVKKCLKNIIAVKNKYYGIFENNVHDGKILIQKLNVVYKKTTLPLVCPKLMETLYKTFTAQLRPVNQGRRQMLSKRTIEMTNTKIQILENICNLYDKRFQVVKPPPNCVEYLEYLLKRLTTEKERVTDQEVDDYEIELMRLRRIIDFSYYSTPIPTHKTLESDYKDLQKKLYSSGPYNVEEDETIKKEVERLSRSRGMLHVSECELKQIIKVVGVKSGAWYKCPNGHPYAIGECGGAMQQSNCVDCGAPIGGRNHALAAGNSHFSIDGSRYAAWSEQANLQNYEL